MNTFVRYCLINGMYEFLGTPWVPDIEIKEYLN